jgi:hypothetical protein
MTCVREVKPGAFHVHAHFYPRVLVAHTHPLVRSFLALGNARIAARYCHIHPEVDAAALAVLLQTQPRYFRWGGADLLHVITGEGVRRIVVIETNSCPSGQKSMPRSDEEHEQAGYRTLLERSFMPLVAGHSLPAGRLAVLYDKNPMEASGYAATLADLTDEPVLLVYAADTASDLLVWHNGVLHVQGTPIRAAVRYVTQRPWNRIPVLARTCVFNPVLACLAGGRNKMLAAKAYDLYNAEVQPYRLRIHAPATLCDVTHAEIPMAVRRMGGVAVVKDPYSNAGQGVFTITSPAELDAFMRLPQRYGRSIVQALIGNVGWSSRTAEGTLCHVGTVPNEQHEVYVADLRFMVGGWSEGFYPVAIYARRARIPLGATAGSDSWAMLGTNLSVRDAEGNWTTQSERLLLMDRRDFNRLGIGLDDLIESYIQTVLAMTAIDKMAQNLVTRNGKFRRRYFASLNPDQELLREIP